MRPANRAADQESSIGPFACLFGAVVCFQLGAVLAVPLFPVVGPQGASALRLGLAASVLVAIVRPWRQATWLDAMPWTIGYGLGVGGLNMFFYLAIRTIPLGVAVAIGFLGPLGLAALSSRRPIDILWTLLAFSGLLCLLPRTSFGAGLDLGGMRWAFLSAASWVAYITCGQRAGRVAPGVGTVALGLAVAAAAVIPVGVAEAGPSLLRPGVWSLGLALALISCCIPFSLEMVALRRLPTRTFGVLMSLEPVVGAVLGAVFLGQRLTPVQAVAIALVIAASAGSALTKAR